MLGAGGHCGGPASHTRAGFVMGGDDFTSRLFVCVRIDDGPRGSPTVAGLEDGRLFRIATRVNSDMECYSPSTMREFGAWYFGFEVPNPCSPDALQVASTRLQEILTAGTGPSPGPILIQSGVDLTWYHELGDGSGSDSDSD